MRVVSAIVSKQMTDTLKNKMVFIQFVMLPVLTIFMNSMIKIDGMPHNFFVNMFSSMFVGMAPLNAMTSIISEEKEKNTLRVLMMSDVKPLQYLIGTGGYIWANCMLGASVFCILGKFSGVRAAGFLGIMSAGILCSILIGAAIGIGCKNQMAAGSVMVPVMMVFSFLPMLSMFNDTIKKIAKWTYSEQISLIINELDAGTAEGVSQGLLVIAANMLVACLIFCGIYNKKGLQ